MRQTTYSIGCISVEGYGTSRNVISNQKHVSNTIGSDRNMKTVCR